MKPMLRCTTSSPAANTTKACIQRRVSIERGLHVERAEALPGMRAVSAAGRAGDTGSSMATGEATTEVVGAYGGHRRSSPPPCSSQRRRG
jgi:hypothetical protein